MIRAWDASSRRPSRRPPSRRRCSTAVRQKQIAYATVYAPAIPVTAQRSGSSRWQATASSTFDTPIHSAIRNGVRVSSNA